MGKKKVLLYSAILVFLFIAILGIREYNLYKYNGSGMLGALLGVDKKQASYDDFAKCLTQKGFAMGGTEWCPHCKNQKALFGPSFQYINYKNCDLYKEWCDSKGITGYPTWVSPDGTLHSGEQDFSKLSEYSGCSINSTA
jgi:hypothetical protein